jgi:hypothetical protein
METNNPQDWDIAFVYEEIRNSGRAMTSSEADMILSGLSISFHNLVKALRQSSAGFSDEQHSLIELDVKNLDTVGEFYTNEDWIFYWNRNGFEDFLWVSQYRGLEEGSNHWEPGLDQASISFEWRPQQNLVEMTLDCFWCECSELGQHPCEGSPCSLRYKLEYIPSIFSKRISDIALGFLESHGIKHGWRRDAPPGV